MMRNQVIYGAYLHLLVGIAENQMSGDDPALLWNFQ
jgi:hypothetical protein